MDGLLGELDLLKPYAYDPNARKTGVQWGPRPVAVAAWMCFGLAGNAARKGDANIGTAVGTELIYNAG
jgi:hypothetical protein